VREPSPTEAAVGARAVSPGDVAVLVSSSDAYTDVWQPFFELFFRYWPDCPYPVYLGSNERELDDPRVHSLTTGPDEDWSTAFTRMLDALPQRFVIVLLEDYLLDRPIDSARIERLVRYTEARDAACLRLLPVPGADVPSVDEPEVGELPVGAPYRLSLQAAIWDRASLRALVRPGESPWELEMHGSERTGEIERPFLSVVWTDDPPLPYFCTGVVRGIWLRDAVALCRRRGVHVDLTARPRESRYLYFRRTVEPRIRRALRRR
jgi:hypothetical protein